MCGRGAFSFFFLLFGRGGLIPSARSRAPRWHCTRAGEAARGGLDHETAHDVCLLSADSLGSEGHDVFPLSLGMACFPPGRTALVSAHHAHLIYYSSAQAQGSVHISTSAAVAALQPCQQETWWHMAVLANSIPSSLLPGMLSVCGRILALRLIQSSDRKRCARDRANQVGWIGDDW